MIEVKEHRGYMVGDRVRYGRAKAAGEVVVAGASDGMLGVRFDDYAEHRHDLGGRVPNGYGWWVFPRELERE